MPHALRKLNEFDSLDVGITDAELIKAYKKGDTEALEKIMKKYKTPIYAYLLKMVRNTDYANDLFQEIFLKLIKNIQSYNEEQKFANWIYTVAHNMVIDGFRKNKNRRFESLDQSKGEDAGHISGLKTAGETIASKELSPENILIKNETDGKIEKAFEILSDEQREVFIMRHYWGLSFKEIAKILKVPIGTALARMARALSKLKFELREVA